MRPLDDLIARVEESLRGMLSGVRPQVLSEAMSHAVLAGGKRVRPRLCLASAAAAGGDPSDALMPACAIELLHSYTLVHDDLPSMDGDETRRGLPTVWRKFGEDAAVLAGDALQALAFRAAARSPRAASAVVAELGEAAFGVVRGQVADLRGGGVRFICRHKTADLFVAAAAMGALAVGAAPDAVRRLRRYALSVGLAFQHEDDLLDGDSPIPEDAARARVASLTADALRALDGLPGDASPLEALARRLAGRGA